MAEKRKATSNELVFENCGCTKITTVRFRYTWIISNFSFYCNAMGSKIVSPGFSNQLNSSQITWYLEINPNGWYQDCKSDVSCMSLYLHLESSTASDFETNFKLSIVNTKSEEVYKFEDNKVFGQGKFYGNNSFIEKWKLLSEKAELYPDDKLTILCDITALAGSLNNLEKLKPLPIKHHVSPENTMKTKSHILSRDELISRIEEKYRGITGFPGIHRIHFYRLQEAGFGTAGKLLEKFFELEEDRDNFVIWLKATCGTKHLDSCFCSLWLISWCEGISS